MKNIKVLSFVLALAVVLSLVALPVSATIPEEDAYNNAVDAFFSVLASCASVMVIIAIIVAIVLVVVLVVRKNKRG